MADRIQHREGAHQQPRSWWRSFPWSKALLAILAGNVAYYLLGPHLPDIWQHKLFQVDLGLGLDFVFCVAAYLLVRTLLG